MKACPECAESVQDAARKCRYCGYQFVSGEQSAAAPPPAAAPASAKAGAATASSNGPFLFVAAGGVLVALGGLLVVFANLGDFEYGNFGVDAFVFGGVLLAIGWGVLLGRGQAAAWPLIGSLVLVVGWLIGAFVSQSDDAGFIIAGVLGNAALAICAFMHFDALELEGWEGARLAAMIAAAGFVIATVAASRQLPEVVQVAGLWAGMIGTVLFGGALAFAAGQRGMSPTPGVP
jgi:hypothetical protein